GGRAPHLLVVDGSDGRSALETSIDAEEPGRARVILRAPSVSRALELLSGEAVALILVDATRGLDVEALVLQNDAAQPAAVIALVEPDRVREAYRLGVADHLVY